MANEEHLNLLRQGVDIWNEKRPEKADLSKANLSGANLSGTDLSGTDLSKSDLSGANLSGANLSRIYLNRTYLNRTYLSKTYLSRTNLSGANLSRTNLSRLDLSGFNLSGASLSGANLSASNLSGFDLSGFDLSEANLSEANLSGAKLSGANLSGTDLSGFDLSKSDLSGANLSGNDLSGFDLSKSDLSKSDLRRANLKGANLRGANLSETDLGEANLNKADLSGANLSGANLNKAHFSEANLIAVNLSKADLRKSHFRDANLRLANLSEIYAMEAYFGQANLNEADLRSANLSKITLSGANLSEANLSEVDLNEAVLIETNLIKANLSSANLVGSYFRATQLLGTNFNNANLTGACIEDWNININTNFTNVICDYIYLRLKEYQQNNIMIFTERRPSNPDENFAPGDFARLVQKTIETVDLIFRDGIEWKSFALSLQELNQEAKIKIASENDPLSIRAIETRDDGSFVIRVNIPAELDKGEIEKSFKQKYSRVLKAREEYYRRELQAKDSQIEIYRQHNTSLERIIDTLANKPININNMPNNGDNFIQSGQFGIGQMSGGEIKDQAKIAGVINEGQQNNLNMIKVEIEQILKPLLEQYPTNTTSEQMIVASQAIQQIENNPSLKARFINAAKEGSLAALEQSLNHPVCSFIINAVKGWQEAQ